MAAELTPIKLNAEELFLLDQPLLRLPTEVNRANLKAAQIAIDQAKKGVVPAIAKASSDVLASSDDAQRVSSAASALLSLDAMIARTNNLKRKLSVISNSTEIANASLGTRLKHLNELNSISSLGDVKYDEWSRTRLDRLLVDYLLRMGYMESAEGLARAKGIGDLVQVEISAFESCGRIERALRERSTKEALSWCNENKKELAKIDSVLEFELRLQQYIELIRSGERMQALEHAKKYFAIHRDQELVMRAAGLLAFSPEMPYDATRLFFSSSRWDELADRFVKTHHQLYSIPSVPQLNTALSAGLSALKTPACHSRHNPHTSAVESLTNMANGHTHLNGAVEGSALLPATADSIIDRLNPANGVSANVSSNAPIPAYSMPICPICSTELNALARNVPYAHHSKSHVDPDPVVLPNGRIYGNERLRLVNEKLGTASGKVRDPLDGKEFDEASVRKVFIS